MREGRTPVLGPRRGRVTRALLIPLVVMASGCLVDATWTSRAVEPVVEPVPDRFTLVDVACPEAGACVAIGSLGTLPLASEPVVLRQTGSAWQRVDLPDFVPAAHGVSCVGADDCVVLGPVDLRYHGGELTLLPQPPLNAGSTGAALDCVPAGGCLQVDGSSSSWWDGTSWSAPIALPAAMMRETPRLSGAAATSCLLVATRPRRAHRRELRRPGSVRDHGQLRRRPPPRRPDQRRRRSLSSTAGAVALAVAAAAAVAVATDRPAACARNLLIAERRQRDGRTGRISRSRG